MLVYTWNYVSYGDGQNIILVLRQEVGLCDIFQLYSYLQVGFSKTEIYLKINVFVHFVMDYIEFHIIIF